MTFVHCITLLFLDTCWLWLHSRRSIRRHAEIFGLFQPNLSDSENYKQLGPRCLRRGWMTILLLIYGYIDIYGIYKGAQKDKEIFPGWYRLV